jgi:signal transduction histidine kinase
VTGNPNIEAAAMLNSSLESGARVVGRDKFASAQNIHNGQGHLIAIVAHELRGPLVPIRNTVALLKRSPLDAATIQRAAELIERQVVGMGRLIDDLVDVSQLTSGNLEIRPLPVTLADIVGRCVELVGDYVSQRGHKLSVEVPAEPILLMADAMRLCQALQNLVTNAAKYTNDGGEIWIRARREGCKAVIAVSDNGIGIAADQLRIIFDLFAQDGQAGTRRSEGGLGIGLFLTRNLVEAHGGNVTATSAGPGRGSEFTVRLPCGDPDERGAEAFKTNGAAQAGDRFPS